MRLRNSRSGTSTPNATDIHDNDDGHDNEVVELTRLAFIAEAIAIKQDLERIGIRAVVFESDAGGWAPHFGIEQGNRVMVRAQDLAQARHLLSDDGGQVAVDEQAAAAPFKKHLRRHGDS